MTATMSGNLVLSPSGICKTFDAEADGYGRGEAVNAIYLKRLDDALRSNDPIRAVIRSTSVNCDGKTSNITNPSTQAQAKLIRAAYKRAGIEDPSLTAFVECHGTGTVAGDAAECSAIENVVGARGTVIGAVKPNFGHSEGASGITSVIKAVLSLEHGTIPPNAHFKTPNPSLAQGRLTVPCEPMDWPADRQKRVGVNGFGIGGTNAHIILDSADEHCPKTPVQTTPRSNGPFVLVLSAKDATSLQARIKQMVDYVQMNPHVLPDLAFTLSTRRRHLPHRAFVLYNEGEQLQSSDFVTAQSTLSPRLSFAFTGQGGQWIGMGKSLMETYESFRADIEGLGLALRSIESPPAWSLEEELSRLEGSRINEVEFCQPLTTAVQIGLVNLLARFGVCPTDVIGHSSGEIGAAYAAGAITADSAIIIAYYRGKLAKSQMNLGEMASIGLSSEDVAPYLIEGVSIACQNSSQNVTISGDKQSIDEVVKTIKARLPDVFCKRLRLNIAYHSRKSGHFHQYRTFNTHADHMKPVGLPYETAISNYVDSNHHMLPMFSSVNGNRITDAADLTAKYWRQNLESPVLFADAMNNLLDSGNAETNHIILEIGPHSVLSSPIKQILQARHQRSSTLYVPTLIRYNQDCKRQLLSATGIVHIHGLDPDLLAITGPGRPLTDIPPYPWNREAKYWSESRAARDWRLIQEPYHELLGLRCAEATDFDPSWRSFLCLENVPWLSDHVIQDQIVFPGAGYIAMAGEAVRQIYPDKVGYSIKRVLFLSPLLLEEHGSVEVVTSLRPHKFNDITDSNWFNFTISSHDGTKWVKNSTGQVCAGTEELLSAPKLNHYARNVSPSQWYQTLSAMGVYYGEKFKGLQNITADPSATKAAAEVVDRMECQTSRYAVHPTMIDQCLQAMSVAAAKGLSRHVTTGAIPASIASLYVGKGNMPMKINVDVSQSTTISLVGNATAVVDDEITLLIRSASFHSFGTVDEAVTRRIPLSAQIQWMPDIDFVDPQSLVPPVTVSMEALQPLRLTAQLTLLYILETVDLLRDVQPTTTHMAKWKTGIMKQANEAWSGHVKMFPDSGNWRSLSQVDRQALMATIKSQLEEQDGDSTIGAICMEQIYNHCQELMTGVSSLDLLMSDNLISRYYDFGNKYADWSRFLRLLCHSNPRLRILEVGAGTGSATSKVLKSLHICDVPMYSQYVFTDISNGFLGPARDKFGQYKGLDFKVLDIARDPVEQGYSPHTFDLVIASNVLHATPLLKKTLQNIRKLLTSSGHLLLHELSSGKLISYILLKQSLMRQLETRNVDYIMGTLPGWWVGEEDGRVDRPYISPERWSLELQAAGFTGADAFCYDLEPPLQVNTTILSQVAANTLSPLNQRLTIVTSDRDDDWVLGFSTELTRLGHEIEYKSLEELPTGCEYVIFLMDVHEPFLYNMSPEDFDLLRTYLSHASQCKLVWVTKAAQISCDDPRYSLVPGFVRTLRAEMMLELSMIEVDSFGIHVVRALGDILGKVFCEKEESQDLETEFVLHDGTIYTSRCCWGLQPESNSSLSSKKLTIGTPGVIDTLRWTEAVDAPLQPHDIEAKDIMVAMGFFGQSNEMGIEGTGIVQRVGSSVRNISIGDRVLLLDIGILGTHAVVHEQRCAPLPEELSLEDAATMPTVFLTAIYSLIDVAQIRKDQSVLIHSACGGVGLAAIQVCRLIGVKKIFATVGNDDKKQYLVQECGLPASQIFNSRNKSFLPSLMQVTNGRGVDIVLNSLSEELLHASWECVAPFGKMIELGKRDFLTNGTLDMRPFLNNRAFFGVDLLELGDADVGILNRLMYQTLSWYKEGKIQPIRPTSVFEASRIIDAFRYMQTGTHKGKVLIKMPDDPAQLPGDASWEPTLFSHDAAFLLIGGLGGLGRAVSIWMVENGARCLVYLSRSAGSSNSDQKFIHELELMGCAVEVCQGDVANIDDVKRAVSLCPKPLKGVLHMAMALNDYPFPRMSFEQWQASLAPKVRGAWNLHLSVSNESLDFFVMFSSIVGICGNVSQANYAAANTFLDGLTLHRRQHGLPASSLAVVAVEDVGFVSQDQKMLNHLKSGGLRIISEAELVKGLRLCIEESRVISLEESKTLRSVPHILGLGHTRPLSDSSVRPYWYRDARFRSYTNLESIGMQQTDTATGSKLKKFMVDVEKDPSILLQKETATVITRELISLMTQHTAEPRDAGDEDLLNIVIDSLMMIEIRNWTRRNISIEVSLADVSKAHTVGGLAGLVIERLKMKFNVAQAAVDDLAAESAA
ncbi:polyketide synthase [Penicillium nucicola]|uniref:polyketide synthase n=1 Tax=Penicillium nucicola TaxID=1850975 RepID=UPI0025459D3D|nr:polyketide synthase [Penicillium nucicola]KAJ5762471.1 polyketide synthase [Penicillium nucicola]